MVKLITQFDNEKTKLSLATPTCGACCCCCCCCCIVSTFATASISARNFGSYVEEKLPNEPEKIKHARRFGFWLPIGLLINLGITLLFIYAFELDSFISIITLITIGILYLFVETYALRKKLNLPGITGEVIKSLVLLGAFEVTGVFAGMLILIHLNRFNWLYLVGAIVVSILLIRWAFERKYDDLGKEKFGPDVQIEKKECPNCGTENDIDNKTCIYCSNSFEKDDEK